jgi:hypothetical protein
MVTELLMYVFGGVRGCSQFTMGSLVKKPKAKDKRRHREVLVREGKWFSSGHREYVPVPVVRKFQKV